MTRHELIKQLTGLGYQTKIAPNGVNMYIYLDGQWVEIQDTITQLPIDLAGYNDVVQRIKKYSETPLDERGVIHHSPTYRVKDFMWDVTELGFTVRYIDNLLHIIRHGQTYIQIDPKEYMNIQSQELYKLPPTTRRQLMSNIQQLLLTPLKYRNWEYTEYEQDVLNNFPSKQWVQRDDITGGILLYNTHPDRDTAPGTQLIPYQDGVFLNIGYDTVYKI